MRLSRVTKLVVFAMLCGGSREGAAIGIEATTRSPPQCKNNTGSSSVVLHLSDPHLTMSPTAWAHRNMARVVARARAEEPEPAAVILTGDLSGDGTAQSYEHLADILCAAWDPGVVPILYVPGNADGGRLDTMRRVLDARGLRGAARAGSPLMVRIGQAWDVLLLSSAVPGELPGRLASADLGWLRRQLSNGTRPALLALHHPPLSPDPRDDTNIWTSHCLQRPQELLAAVREHGRARVLLHGPRLRDEAATRPVPDPRPPRKRARAPAARPRGAVAYPTGRQAVLAARLARPPLHPSTRTLLCLGVRFRQAMCTPPSPPPCPTAGARSSGRHPP